MMFPGQLLPGRPALDVHLLQIADEARLRLERPRSPVGREHHAIAQQVNQGAERGNGLPAALLAGQRDQILKGP